MECVTCGGSLSDPGIEEANGERWVVCDACGDEQLAKPERKFQMVRLRAGDYLLPSNDERTLYRIAAVWEDGSAVRFDGTPIVGRRWSVLLWDRGDWHTLTPEDCDGWDRWREVAQMFRTRQEAIDYALERESTVSR